MESFFNSLKSEWVFHRRYADCAEAKADLVDYIEVFCNRKRQHSSLNYQSPAVHYTAWLERKDWPHTATLVVGKRG